MSATDERGRVLAHEAVARCLAEYDLAQSAPLRSGHRSGVVLAFSAARASRAQLRFSPFPRQQAD